MDNLTVHEMLHGICCTYFEEALVAGGFAGSCQTSLGWSEMIWAGFSAAAGWAGK